MTKDTPSNPPLSDRQLTEIGLRLVAVICNDMGNELVQEIANDAMMLLAEVNRLKAQHA